MFLHVTNAKPLDGYRVEVCFDDGREGIADLTEALEGPMFGPLTRISHQGGVDLNFLPPTESYILRTV